MYTNKVKRIAAVHDLSGFGRVSLTVVIPILSSMGFQVCPLPTAVLSSHTQYPEFSILDLTDEMPRIIAEWKKLDVQFDAFYTGYLGAPRQVQIVSDFIDDFRQPDSLVVVDPVLGDNGRLYTNFDESMIREMRHLAAKADVITPNLTELFYLMDKPYKADNTDEELKSYLRLLSDACPWRKSQDCGICLQSGRRSLLENNLSLSACSLSGNGGYLYERHHRSLIAR